MPVSLTTIVAPVVLFSMMPPVGGAGGGTGCIGSGGASLMTMVFCSVVGARWFVRRNRRRRQAPAPALRPRAPEAADPDRIVRVALLELDPDAGADLRHMKMPFCLPAIGTHGIAQVDRYQADTSGTIA